MGQLFQYMPYIVKMSPSIGISFVFLSLTLCVSFIFDWEGIQEVERITTIIILTMVIFGISLSIGEVIKKELPEAQFQSDVYDITIHEEFLIALTVEMAGAIFFVLPIYGSDRKPPHIYFSLGVSLLFISLLFILPIATMSQAIISTSPEIIDNYISNFRVELLSIIVLFFALTVFRIAGLQERNIQKEKFKQLLFMAGIIILVIIFFNKIILEPQYENLLLAIVAAIITLIILAVAKLHQTMLFSTIFLAIALSIVFLIGTQIENFFVDAPTAINLVAELIGAIMVALILDTDLNL